MLGPQIVVHSFGFLHEVPPCSVGSLLVDLRTDLRNPHHDPAMRQLTGLDDPVRTHVLDTPGCAAIIGRTVHQAIALHAEQDRHKYLTRILIGCQGGRHRSVVVATEVHDILRAHGYRTELVHEHITRPVVQR